MTMMKKAYIIPQTTVDVAEAEQMLAVSMLNPNKDAQTITIYEDEYDGEFSAKEYSIDW